MFIVKILSLAIFLASGYAFEGSGSGSPDTDFCTDGCQTFEKLTPKILSLAKEAAPLIEHLYKSVLDVKKEVDKLKNSATFNTELYRVQEAFSLLARRHDKEYDLVLKTYGPLFEKFIKENIPTLRKNGLSSLGEELAYKFLGNVWSSLDFYKNLGFLIGSGLPPNESP